MGVTIYPSDNYQIWKSYDNSQTGILYPENLPYREGIPWSNTALMCCFLVCVAMVVGELIGQIAKYKMFLLEYQSPEIEPEEENEN